MSRLTGSKSKYRERHKQGHAPSGLNGASQDFEQAGHTLVREGCGAARCVRKSISLEVGNSKLVFLEMH